VAPKVQPVADPDTGSCTGRFRLLLADRILQLPNVAGDAIDAISRADDGLRVCDIPGLDAPSRRVVARRLVREGACIVERR
jgi:hypothetical protein